MTTDEINALTGPALDAAVAEKLFGWTEVAVNQRPVATGYDASKMWRKIVPRYSDWLGLPLVLAKLDQTIQHGKYPIVITRCPAQWSCQVRTGPQSSVTGLGDTLPLAVCRAALMAMEE